MTDTYRLFTTPSCTRCVPVKEYLSSRNDIPVETVDATQNREQVFSYGIRGVPTLIRFDKDGGIRGQVTGDLEAVVNFLDGVSTT